MYSTTNTDENTILENIKTLENEILEKKQEISYQKTLINKRNEISFLNVFPDDDDNSTSKKFRIGHYDLEKLTKLPDFETVWQNSFYVTRQTEVEKIISSSFNMKQLERMLMNPFKINLKDGKNFSIKFNFVCILDAILPCEEGYTMVLTDPYATVQTIPLNDTDIKTVAMQNLGKPVYVKLKFTDSAYSPECIELKPTIFSMN